MFTRFVTGPKQVLLAGFLAGGILTSTVFAQTAQGKGSTAVTPAPASSPAPNPSASAQRTSPYHPSSFSNRARNFYQLRWGVDSFEVRSVESGQLIRFSYRVIDPAKAGELNDKKATPYLLDERARVKLVVPTMEKVGQLRQSAAPEAGKNYWMVFSNKGSYVKRGNRVSVVIGKFRVDGLVVQ
ncbi:MAG TPA: hypothetical protein VGF08_09915 [Terriglobales bacterium]|jgi:hypothetical protein